MGSSAGSPRCVTAHPGSALGYRVVAIDRPGYGASHGLVRDSVRADRQTEIVLDLIDMLRAASDTGAAVFLIGHSMGAVLALLTAASAHAAAIAGLRRALFYGPTGPSTRA